MDYQIQRFCSNDKNIQKDVRIVQYNSYVVFYSKINRLIRDLFWNILIHGMLQGNSMRFHVSA